MDHHCLPQVILATRFSTTGEPQLIERIGDGFVARRRLTKKVWTLTGLKTFYVLFFIHLATRRIHLAGFTTNPYRAWMRG